MPVLWVIALNLLHCPYLAQVPTRANILLKVNCSSVNGQIGWPRLAAYGASKHAVLGLTRSAAKEYPGIRLNCPAPGK